MEQRVSLITLGVADVPASRAFYTKLGWKASSTGGDGVAFFQAGGMVVSLFGRDKLARDAGMSTEPSSGFGGIALAHNVRSKADVDAVLAEAERAGGRIVRPAADAFWGGYSGYFADIDGHLWEVAWNPTFPLDEQGRVKLPEI